MPEPTLESELSSIITCIIEGLKTFRRGNKVGHLREMALQNQALFVALTETQLNEEIYDAEICMDGYTIFRADRTLGRSKGGVAIYVRDDLASETIVLASSSDGTVEYLLLWTEKIKLATGIIYRPPSCPLNNFENAMKDIEAKINELGSLLPSIILMGDFNFPTMSWVTGRLYGGSREYRCQGECLRKFMEVFMLEQYIMEPTRKDNILDLFLTNNPDIVKMIDVGNTIMSDHDLITVTIDINLEGATEPKEKRDFGPLSKLNFHNNNINWKEVSDEFERIDWSSWELISDIKSKYSGLVKIIEDVCTKLIPPRRAHKSNIIPRDRRILMRRRSKIKKRLRTLFHLATREKLKRKLIEIEEDLEVSHANEAQAEETRVIRAVKKNPKYFYSYAKKKSVTRYAIGPLQAEGRLVTNTKEMSELLREQYESVFSTPKYKREELVVELEGVDEPARLTDLDFTVEDIARSLGELNVNSAPGPDGVPTVLLKNCRETLKYPLYKLWRESLSTGVVPEVLKFGIITPIYKGGKKIYRVNYRPVTLTSHIIKVFERVLVRWIVDFLEREGLFNANQHGFRKGRSCLSQLLEHHMSILEALADGLAVDVVYLDFAKAFDKVDHGVLLIKLRKLGLSGTLLSWIDSFLSDRRQLVLLEGIESEIGDVISGVPQGSVLGPLLFLIHIHDIDSELEFSTASSFADDTRIIRKINSMENCRELQLDLQKIYNWAEQNNMSFNQGKFELMRHGRHPCAEWKYADDNSQEIARKKQVKDLGVIMQEGGAFTAQRESIVQKCKRQIAWILRTFRTRKAEPMLTLFKSLVVPHAEYCSQLWNPVNIGDIAQLEGIQRTFTSKIDGLQKQNYWQRLESLNLYSFQRRRERYLIIYIWKMIQGMVPNFIKPELKIKVKNHIRFGRQCVIPHFRGGSGVAVGSLCEGSFTVVAARLFNSMPRKVRDCDGGLMVFKSALDDFLRNVPDKPKLPNYIQQAKDNTIGEQINQQRLNSGL